MKKFACLFFALIAISSANSLFGQNREVSNTNTKKVVPNTTTGVSTPIVDNVIMDARAKKHYTSEQISAMPTLKKLKVNNMYKESFILDPQNVYTSACTAAIKDQVDVADYAMKRSKSARATVIVDAKCNLSIILLSWDEVRAQEAAIEKEYNSQK